MSKQAAFRERLKLIGGQTLVNEYDELHPGVTKETSTDSVEEEE